MRCESALCVSLLILATCRKETGRVIESSRQDGVTKPVTRKPARLDRVVQLSVSGSYSCALRDDGVVYCWGTPDSYQTMLEWQDPRPVKIEGLAKARSVAVELANAVALEASGRIMAWGMGVFPRYRLVPRSDKYPSSLVLEDADPALDAHGAERRFPESVRAHPDTSPPQVRSTKIAMDTRMASDGRVDVVRGGVCIFSSGEELSCDFYLPQDLPFWRIGEATTFEGLLSMVGKADDELCMLFRNGSVQCWRSDELPPGASGPSGWFNLEIPSAVQLVDDMSDYMALLGDGRVADWSHRSFEPTIVDGVGGLKQVSLGSLVTPRPSGACGVRETGKVVCWTPSFFKERSPPHEIPGISNAVHVEVGSLHACALLADGHVQCWGHNQHGQCGIGEFSDEVKTPTFVVAPEDAG